MAAGHVLRGLQPHRTGLEVLEAVHVERSCFLRIGFLKITIEVVEPGPEQWMRTPDAPPLEDLLKACLIPVLLHRIEKGWYFIGGVLKMKFG